MDISSVEIPNLDINDIADYLGWSNAVFITIAAIDAFFIAIGLHGNMSILARKYILTKTDDPLIKSLGAAELLVVVVRITPVFITALSRKWVLGKVACVILASASLIPHMIELAVITVMPMQRLYVLRFPLRSIVDASKRRKMGITYSVVLWIIMILLGIGSGYRQGSNVAFSPVRLSCQPRWFRGNQQHTGSIVTKALILVLFQVAPLLLTVAANISVLIICSRTANPVTGKSHLRKKSVITILAVTTAFVLSSLPGAVLMVLTLMLPPQQLITKSISRTGATVSIHLSFINVVSHFFIYQTVNKNREKDRRRDIPLSQSHTKQGIKVEGGCTRPTTPCDEVARETAHLEVVFSNLAVNEHING